MQRRETCCQHIMAKNMLVNTLIFVDGSFNNSCNYQCFACMQKQKQYKDLIRYLKTSKNESPSIIHVDKITDKHSAQHLSCVDFSPKSLPLSHNLGNHTQYLFWVENLTVTYVFFIAKQTSSPIIFQ